MSFRLLLLVMFLSVPAFTQGLPPIEPGVPQELAKWRAARYSNVRYKLNLTLEKMSPVLKGTMEIRVTVSATGAANSPPYEGGVAEGRGGSPIVLDWRKIRGYEDKSTISNVTLNGRVAALDNHPVAEAATPLLRKEGSFAYREHNEHLIFSDGVVMGENVIKLDFTSPILTSGSAITRYVDKEDGSEYLYSLFVPSDASTAFPVFDQPDIKARFSLYTRVDPTWQVVSNTERNNIFDLPVSHAGKGLEDTVGYTFPETKPISTYVFAFAAGPWERVSGSGVSSPHVSKGSGDNSGAPRAQEPSLTVGLPTPEGSIYVRKSQAAKFKPHAAEVFRLNREAVKYFEEYFDYKFPWPKYDLVLIPEFPFGGMEHAGATFLREASIIFPQEPTKNDHISRALLMFHEASHQWFGDTVTMRWFDDLWLKEGFATFTAYKAMEKIMPEMNAWKVFYERVKQAAYQTDSTRGTTAIYQPIANLSAAKSAYGNIVYNKAPAFLRQAEFYLGEDKFQAAVRSFLKKHECGNAGWEELVREFENASKEDLNEWASVWVKQPGLPVFTIKAIENGFRATLTDQPDIRTTYYLDQSNQSSGTEWKEKLVVLSRRQDSKGSAVRDYFEEVFLFRSFPIFQRFTRIPTRPDDEIPLPKFLFPNYRDYGYGIFLLDEKSRDYVLKNIQNEKDPFLRSMMWGALWDSVREGELDPRAYVELVVRVLSTTPAAKPATPPIQEGSSKTSTTPAAKSATPPIQEGSFVGDDESTTALLLNRVGTAMNYYIDDRRMVGGTPTAPVRRATDGTPTAPVGRVAGGTLATSVEEMLIAGMRNAETLGQRITYYRAFLNIASSENARKVLKGMLTSQPTTPSAEAAATPPSKGGESRAKVSNGKVKPPATAGGTDSGGAIPLKTKDKFDIVTKLLILNDPEASKLLAELEKTETSDDAKRYAYAARAGIASGENKAKYWNDFVNNKEISESWIEAAFGPWNSIRHSELTLPYLERALKELPNHKRNRKIFFVNGWLGAFIGGQRSEEALAIVNKFLADNPGLDNDLRLKILENVDVIERAVRIRKKF